MCSKEGVCESKAPLNKLSNTEDHHQSCAQILDHSMIPDSCYSEQVDF